MVSSWYNRICIFLIYCNYVHGRILLQESTNDNQDNQLKTPFTLEELFDGTFSASGWNGTWLTDDSFLYKNTNGDFMEFDLNTKTSKLFLNGSILDNYPGASTSLSPDNTYVLIRYNVSSVPKHSTTAIYAIYDIITGEYYDLNNKTAVQLAVFDTTDHAVAYVFENNIFYLPNGSDDNPIQVTTDGIEGVIFNGIPDWVYFEEVLHGSAIWFCPDGNNLAYSKFNDTNVKEFSYFHYGTPGYLGDQYPTLVTTRYPKAGTPNPVVNTYVYNLNTATTTQFELIDSIKNSEEDNDYIFFGLTWVSNSEVAMISSNRVQNESVIIRCRLDGSCEEEVSYQQENGWLEPALPEYSLDGTKRLEILPQPEQDDLFQHLVLTDVSTNTPKRLTYGNRVVTFVFRWDQTNHLVYYGGSANGYPSQQHTYMVDTETGEDTCLTCDLLVDGEYCKYAEASFNQKSSHYIKMCNGPNPAYTVIQHLQNKTDTFIWNENTAIREKLSKKLKSEQLDLIVPVKNNFTARVTLQLPADLDQNKKYPAIVNVYGGPNSNEVSESYASGIASYLVTNRSYIYISIDGRGSGRDGLNKVFQMYRQLGTVEIEDQISVTKFLQDTFPFIDRDNTGIWGWSYGGFAAAWALVQDTDDVFKCGFSVAPVTDFIYYDTIYTERYMGLPTEEDNLSGYQNTDISSKVENIRKKLFLVIHGSGDSNVHYQQTMMLVKALERADIAFQELTYPDEDHGIDQLTTHLSHAMDNFWITAFET